MQEAGAIRRIRAPCNRVGQGRSANPAMSGHAPSGQADALEMGIRAHRRGGAPSSMLDVIFTFGTVAFFAASLAFAAWLDRLDSKEAP